MDKIMMTDYKIIRISNYDYKGSRGDQRFVLTYPVTKETAEKICKLMNTDTGRCDEDYFTVVSEDYKLQEFQP